MSDLNNKKLCLPECLMPRSGTAPGALGRLAIVGVLGLLLTWLGTGLTGNVLLRPARFPIPVGLVQEIERAFG
ncbi:hypothetical protein [Pseudoduganella sp. OTU4001]|uniref:hypothetical protein n=1 Tax=Pseudoduganella sp. OTU4001 TaxID=3043854 RepID=UPI00313B32EC